MTAAPPVPVGAHDQQQPVQPANPWVKVKEFELEVRREADVLQKADAPMAAQPHVKARMAKRREIVANDVQELYLDVHALTQTNSVDNAHVDALINRKRAELKVELEHTVKLTDAEGAHWDPRELNVVDKLLDRVPDNHLAGLSEINRRHVIAGRTDEHAPGVPAATDYKKRLIGMYDSGFSDGGRLSGYTSELSGRGQGVGRGAAATAGLGFVEEDLGHEIGHLTHVLNPKALAKFEQAAQWKDGKGIVAEGDSWSYARTASDEHFAETYTNALNTPEKLYADLIDRPMDAEAEAQKRMIAAQRAVLGAQAIGDQTAIAAAMKKMEVERTKLAAAERLADSTGAQWHIMREDVFGVTDKDVAARLEKVKLGGADKAKLAEFQGKAKMAMTHDQLDRLTTRYGG
jgi:hypothetical protein